MDEQPRLGDPTDMTEQVLAGGAGGLAQRMEIELVLCSSARVVARMPVEGNTQPYGILHGGASVVLAETLGSIGSALHAHYTTGTLKAEGSSITEGIGQGRITANLEGVTPDFSCRIPDSEALPVLYDLLEHEGLCLGGSSGINIAGAIRMARDMGPGHTIVTVLCDYGNRYQSKLFNPQFLREKNLPVPEWLDGSPRSIPGVFVE